MNRVCSARRTMLALSAAMLLPTSASWAQTGQTSISLSASAYHDNQSFFKYGDGTTTIGAALAAEDITGSTGSNYSYGSTQRAWARGWVDATSIKLFTRAYTYSQSLGPTYSAFANASAQASVNTPFMVQGGGQAGTSGTLVATVLLSGNVEVGNGPGSAFYDFVTHAEARGKASMYFWANGLNATGCTYYVDAACLDIRRDYTGDTVNSNNALRAWTLTIPFQFGNWSSVNMQLWSSADSYVTANGSGGWIQYHAESDIEHTVRWGGISAILDSQGQAVSGWTVTSLPGVDLAVAAVPESASWAMALMGLLVLLAMRRRWARQAN